jgi:hypothetical protein
MYNGWLLYRDTNSSPKDALNGGYDGAIPSPRPATRPTTPTKASLLPSPLSPSELAGDRNIHIGPLHPHSIMNKIIEVGACYYWPYSSCSATRHERRPYGAFGSLGLHASEPAAIRKTFPRDTELSRDGTRRRRCLTDSGQPHSLMSAISRPIDPTLCRIELLRGTV